MKDDYARRRLQARGDAETLDTILQDELRRKHARKLPEEIACEAFRFPDTLAAEQSTGDAVATSRWQSIPISRNHGISRCLDMTMGLGIDAFHAARAGWQVTAIELDPHRAATAAANAKALGINNMEVINADSVEWLRQYDGGPFDLIFIDPARRDARGGRVYSMADCTPDVTAIMPLLLKNANRVIVKASPMIDLEQARRELGRDADITVYGDGMECKEVTITVPGSGKTFISDGIIVPIPIETGGAPVLLGTTPVPSMWLYEPTAAVMKAAPWGWLCSLGTSQIGPDCHLYVSSERVTGFPGREWHLREVLPSGRDTFRKLQGIEAQVAVRGGYPMTAEALRKKLGVKRESDTTRLWGVVTAQGRQLLVADRVVAKDDNRQL